MVKATAKTATRRFLEGDHPAPDRCIPRENWSDYKAIQEIQLDNINAKYQDFVFCYGCDKVILGINPEDPHWYQPQGYGTILGPTYRLCDDCEWHLVGGRQPFPKRIPHIREPLPLVERNRLGDRLLEWVPTIIQLYEVTNWSFLYNPVHTKGHITSIYKWMPLVPATNAQHMILDQLGEFIYEYGNYTKYTLMNRQATIFTLTIKPWSGYPSERLFKPGDGVPGEYALGEIAQRVFHMIRGAFSLTTPNHRKQYKELLKSYHKPPATRNELDNLRYRR